MSLPDDANRHRLPAGESDRIFADEILPAELGHLRPASGPPAAVFIVAQPGSGKTPTAQRVAEVLHRRGGSIEIDSDLFKPFHPDYERLLVTDDRMMAVYTRPDGQRWMSRAEHHVRTNRLNAVVHETAKDPTGTLAKMGEFADAGYRVEVVFLVVPEAMSRQGILNRYHQQVGDRGNGRLTHPANHVAAYAGIPRLARLLDEQAPVDRVAVFRRGDATPRQENERSADGGWRSPAGLESAIETERGRPWTRLESARFLDTHQVLATGLRPAAWSGDVERVLRQEAPHLLTETRRGRGLGPEFRPELLAVLRLADPLMHPELAEAAATLRR